MRTTVSISATPMTVRLYYLGDLSVVSMRPRLRPGRFVQRYSVRADRTATNGKTVDHCGDLHYADRDGPNGKRDAS